MDYKELKSKFAVISNLCGIDGIVLGGSQCIGLANEESDVDICIYYNDEIDLYTINKFLSYVDDFGRKNILPEPYSWGKNLNSGGILSIDNYEIDLCVRETAFVKKTIDECTGGNLKVSYQAGYPFGFCNSYYVAEINYCVVLFDNNHILRNLKMMAYSNWNEILNQIKKAYLNEAAFQWICARKIREEEGLFIQSELNCCLFSLLNVYASETGIMFFHNKHALKRLEKESCDKRIRKHIREINSIVKESTENDMLNMFGNLILEENSFLNLSHTSDEDDYYCAIRRILQQKKQMGVERLSII